MSRDFSSDNDPVESQNIPRSVTQKENLSVKERKEKVSQLHNQGIKQDSIAEIVGISRSTVVRDLRELRKSAGIWTEELLNGGYVLEFQENLDVLKDVRRRLSHLLDSPYEHQFKLKVIRGIHDNVSLYNQLLLKGPGEFLFRK